MSQRNIVLLGASYAGLNATHYLVRHIVHTPTTDGSTYHVYVINPSTHFFHRIGGPRAVTAKDPPGVPDDKLNTPLSEAFDQYPSKDLTFVQGKATNVDTAARVITYQPINDPSSSGPKTVEYFSLIIATGFTTPFAPWTSIGDTSDVKAALADFRQRLPTAKNIVIAGGGPAGVETAGEIGEFLNGAPGWFSSGPKHPKAKITIITADEKLLPILRPALAKKAQHMLKRLGVNVVYNTKVVSYPVGQDGKTIVNLSSGEQIIADVFIPATGGIPNTDFLPKELIASNGKVETNAKTLRVDKAGPRVYALGDVGSYTRGGAMAIMAAIPVLMTNLKRDLLAYAGPNKDTKTPTGPDREYTDDLGESQAVPIGRSGGVAAFGGWRLPSFMVWLMKGRDYMLWSLPGSLRGDRWKAEDKWKA